MNEQSTNNISKPNDIPDSTASIPTNDGESSTISTITSTIKEGIDTIAPKTIALTSIVTALGVSTAFIRGDKLALPFYIYAGGGLVMGGNFFLGVHIMNKIRNQDDVVNYAVAGSIQTSAVMAVMKGFKRGAPVGLVIGGLAGAGYHYIGQKFFDYSREVYVKFRSRMVANAGPEPIFVPGKPKFPRNSEATVIDLGNPFSWGKSKKEEINSVLEKNRKPVEEEGKGK